jgi:excisionase family DNA binding protein
VADLGNALPAGSVTVVNVEAWRSRARELAALLTAAGTQPEGARYVRDPGGAAAAGPIEIATVADPDYWSANPAALADALTSDSERSRAGPSRSSLGAAPDGVERLTLTVEEAAAMLGISRAGAYEAVQRGEIPSIKIGRRILVPRIALNKLVGIDPDGS